MTEKNFVIDHVKWHSQVIGNPESPEQVRHRFWILIDFLQKNHLLKHPLIANESLVDDSTFIETSMFTSRGLKLITSKYSNWLKAIDRGQQPENLKILERELKKIIDSE